MNIQGAENYLSSVVLCYVGLPNPTGVIAGVWRKRIVLSIGPN